MRKANKRVPAANDKQRPTVDDLIYFLALGLLIAVPLAFSTLVYTRYSLPKFVVLLIGSSVLALFLVLRNTAVRVAGQVRIRSTLITIVSLYFAVVTLSTIFGVAPLASLFGSHFNFMGLITRLCFLIVFVSLIAGIAASEKRLRATLWVVAATGFLAAGYGIAQAFGVEPFVSRNLYMFASPDGPLLRVSATLGHANYLGNFLLYTTPISIALALAGRGWRRLFALAGAALSVGAIAFSGTRGAWIGIVAGFAVFAFLELRSAAAVLRSRRFVFAGSMLLVMLLALVVGFSPASRSVRERMSALVDEGVSSSGRVLLWRDSLQMVPSFPIVGCGPEGFRKAFLAFKSKALGRLSRKANNESPHSAYLEAAISHGLAGVVLYIAMMVVALKLLIRARRAEDHRWRLMTAGITSSFAAVLVHNIFIFDQIATGLYFFAFVALAQAASNVATAKNTAGEKQAPLSSSVLPVPRKRSFVSRALATGACLLIVGCVWYSVGLVRSERAYRELVDPASQIDFAKLVELGDRITASPLPTGAYNFVFARTVDTFIKKLSESQGATSDQQNGIDAIRTRATALAIEHVEKSLANTLTPDLNYSLLASLALATGNVDKVRDAASEAVRWDPNNYYTRSLNAEAYLIRGEREQAAREAEIALSLYYVSRKAATILMRASGEDWSDESAIARLIAKSRLNNRTISRNVDDLIAEARRLAQSNKLKKAQITLLTAALKAEGPCPDCHRELAIIYERRGRISEAIAQWEKFIELAPDRAVAEKIQPRIEALRQKKKPAA